MITFHIITIFPQYFDGILSTGLFAKAIKSGLIRVNFLNLINFASGKHKRVDERPFGGGPGMILRVEPCVSALESIKPESGESKMIKILLTPAGELFNQKMAEELSHYSDIVMLCGRYEGVDERVAYFVDKKVSIGDYVLHGGESAALVIMESVSRLVKGFMHNDQSRTEELSKGILGCPQYTRPRNFRGLQVPEVLVSGNHNEIKKWREEQSIIRTINRKKVY